MDPVVVDRKKIEELVKVIKVINLPTDTEEPYYVKLNEDILKNLYFTIVAICHQTKSLKGKIEGKEYRGWDYLRIKWLNVVAKDQSYVYPIKLSKISSEEMEMLLADDDNKSTISNAEGRASLLNDIGHKMLKMGCTSIEDLYKKSAGFLVNKNGNGLLKQLSHFEAYSDPVKKKSLFFLSLMENHSLWNYVDDYNLGPPVDYHEIRGHLRLGTVKILDKFLLNKIINNELITDKEDIKIRSATYKSIMFIAKMTGYSPSVLHYFFWNVFRSCCVRDSSHCNSCFSNCTLPFRYASLREKLGKEGCILSNVCMSANFSEKLTEPRVVTEYY